MLEVIQHSTLNIQHSSYPLSRWFADSTTILPHLPPAHIRHVHDARQFLALVRRHFVPMLDHLRRDAKALFRRPDNEIGIVARSDFSFAILDSGDRRRSGAHQIGDRLEIETTLAPDDR